MGLRRGQFRLQVISGDPKGISLNGHGDRAVILRQGPLRLLPAQEGDIRVHQPLGVAVLNREIGHRRQGILLPDEVAQDRVHQSRRPRPVMALCHFHGLVDGRAGRYPVHQ